MTGIEAATCLVSIAYVSSFLVMSAITAIRAGRTIWLFGRGREKQALPALLFRLAFVGAVIWPIARELTGGASSFEPLSRALESEWVDVTGHLLAVAGAGLALLSQRHMGKSWRIGAAEGELGPIIDGGPFAFSRNPVFLGQALLFGGLFLVFPDFVQTALTLALLLAISLQVRIEERVLLQMWGEPYRAYQSRVRRWVGTYSRQKRALRDTAL